MRTWALVAGTVLAAGTAAVVLHLLRRARGRDEIPALISDCEARIQRLTADLEHLRAAR